MIHYATERQGKRLWLKENVFSPRFELKTESVFAQCNGYIGVRAAHPLSLINENRGMFLSGAFNKAYEDEVTELVNIPDVTWFGLTIDGEELYPERTELLSFERKLDIMTGELQITYSFRLASGREILLENRRFASRADRHLFAQELKIKVPCGKKSEIKVKSGINGQRTNSGVSHFTRVNCRVYDRQQMEIRGELKDNVVTVLTECRIKGADVKSRDFQLCRRGIYETAAMEITDGKELVIEKFSHISQAEDEGTHQERTASLSKALKKGYEELFQEHAGVMDEFWKRSYLKIEGISLEEEAAICFAQYHIQGMTPWHTDKSSIAAKGLTGEGYKGHVFWDTEIYILPSLLYTYPEAARNLLKFRYRGLEGARRKAADYNFEGAMFPWEAAKTGEEETPLYAALNIYTGKANKVWSGIKEYHVTADIIYALNQYYETTQDQDFMRRYGYEIAFEAAQFWTACARWDEAGYKYGIYDVIGPDEYTEHIDNNAYTNHMAAYCVRTAYKYACEMQEKEPKLYKCFSQCFRLEERKKKWEKFLKDIYLPKPGADGIIPQDDTFLSKPCLENIEKYKKSQIKQEVLMDYSRDEVVNMQVLKQADVVMLLNLFPHLADEETVRRNVLFYEARTIHDSSLSYCAHAQACAAVGAVDLAEEFFRRCLVIDLDDNPYDTTDGVHSASLGGVWNCLVFGFAGIHYEGKTLYIQPHMPKSWKSMEFRLILAGQEICFKISHNEVRLNCEGPVTEPITVKIGSREYAFADKLSVPAEE